MVVSCTEYELNVSLGMRSRFLYVLTETAARLPEPLARASVQRVVAGSRPRYGTGTPEHRSNRMPCRQKHRHMRKDFRPSYAARAALKIRRERALGS